MTAETATVRLSYVVNHDVMRAALQNFYARTGVQLGADAADGYQIPPGVPAPDFCLLLQNFGRCELGHSTASLNGEIPQLRFDGAQVAHLVIPIRDNSHALGRLISEPFAVASPDFPTVYELARSLPIHPDNLMRAVGEIRVVAPGEIMEAANLVQTLVQHVVAQSYKHQDELSVLRAFDSIMTNLSYEVLTDMILNLSTRLLRGRAALLVLQGEQGEREEAYSGPEPDDSGDLRRLLGEMSDFVLQSRRPLSVPDSSQSPWSQHLLGRSDVAGSVTITPLLQQERVRGTLGVYGPEASRDPESDLHLLSMLAAQSVNSLVMLERLVASEEQALTDGLTGLYNYRFFQEHLQRELSRASRSKAPLSLIVLDIDNFKVINDTHGHSVGDRVIRHLADSIQRHTRKANVLVRYGGDEFCIIVTEGDLETARAVAERILAEIRASPYGDEAHGIPKLDLSVSAGVTSYRPEEDNAFSFFKRADENLLTAKRTGKDRVVAA
ncbi:MAG: diguanylate cyclase [Chloroflexi bacterium]|nr:MAG: diguanylate cyclase [Chloroflexota bacterium]